ncbi:MAG TPA: MerR family transcriptional regulator [Pyrinomonadaceae bacterium]|jgi:DNA-binding transcriptional MerR regulator
MPVLESYRGRDIIGVEELAGVATSLIEHYSRAPLRGNVRLAISPRTVRHYLSESLLGEPTGQTGTSTVFNYGNLLRLLAVKKLLADHWSVVKIKEFMRALDITALEEMVNGALSSARASHEEAKLAGEKDSTKPLQRTTEALSTNDEQESASTSTLFAVERTHRHEREVAEWVEIAPGLEVKVRRSFRLPTSEEDRARLVTRFWSVILKEE